ncbi:uncharacterized protein [Centruroides vittatus]|uniref:uncharacterized protein n=1 Tax=Centruroides vittatus TaxID=120091 RepID=UPI00351091D9
MVYGTTLRLPADFIQPTNNNSLEPPIFLQRLRNIMNNFSPVQTSAHDKIITFLHPSIMECSHVFVRNDSVKKPLQAPYDGPYQVIARSNKHFTILIKGRDAVISVDRLKPAFIDTTTNDTSNPPVNKTSHPVTPTQPPITTTRSGRHVRFNPRYL